MRADGPRGGTRRLCLAGADRGQAHTLEAFAAAVILLASVVFALQVTAVTPLTASTSSQHIENQQGAVAEGVLAATEESIEDSILRWNSSGGTFWGTDDEGTYADGGPDTRFGRVLDSTFLEEGIAFNVNVYYLSPDGSVSRQRMVYVGGPSDHATVATTTVTLRDGQQLLEPDGTPTGEFLGSASYFASDVRPQSPVYNVLTVEVVVWRM